MRLTTTAITTDGEAPHQSRAGAVLGFVGDWVLKLFKCVVIASVRPPFRVDATLLVTRKVQVNLLCDDLEESLPAVSSGSVRL